MKRFIIDFALGLLLFVAGYWVCVAVENYRVRKYLEEEHSRIPDTVTYDTPLMHHAKGNISVDTTGRSVEFGIK